MNANTMITVDAYNNIADPISAMTALGNAIAKSKLFGCETVEQGTVLAMECLAQKMAPLSLANTYHIIHGRLSMKADAMLAGFLQAGGTHRIVERTADKAEIELTYQGESQRFVLTWADAQNEPFVYGGKESETVAKLVTGKDADRKTLKVKDKYATPRSRTQMLWARVVSDGVRTMMPGVNSGRYSPEEMDDVDDGENAAPAKAATKARNTTTVTTATPATTTPGKPQQVANDDVIDGEVVPKTETAGQGEAKKPEPAKSEVVYATTEQTKQLGSLFAALQCSEESMRKILAKRNSATLHGLTAEQAAELIGGLELRLEESKKLAAKEAENAKVAEAAAAEDSPAETTVDDKPRLCSDEQTARLKAKIGELSQIDSGLTIKVRTLLTTIKRQKLAELSERDSDAFYKALCEKQFDSLVGRKWEDPIPF